ncbi:MAG: hypothetical protein ACLUFI_05080 [Oscillospiraceae bacterium]
MTLTVWQAREYDNILTKPDIPSAVSDAKQAITKFCEQYASVELKNVYNGRALAEDPGIDGAVRVQHVQRD